jgi:hypothetical protein
MINDPWGFEPLSSSVQHYPHCMNTVEVAAVMIGDGSYELMRLDDSVNSTMLIDRVEAKSRLQLETAIRLLLPDMEVDEGLRRVFAGAVSVSLEQWMTVKRMRLGMDRLS